MKNLPCVREMKYYSSNHDGILGSYNMYLNSTGVLSWVSYKTIAYFIAFWKTFDSIELGLYMLYVSIITCSYPPQCCLMFLISVYSLHF